MIDALKAEIIREEGLRLKPYRDSLGNLTIGYGTLIEPGKAEISQDAAEYLMVSELLKCARDLSSFPFWHHANEPRLRALISMRYQLGAGGFRKFQRMIEAANTGDWYKASLEALDSLWAAQTPERARRIANRLRTGE